MTEAMAFWSVILPPKGKPVQQEVESTPSVLSSIHVTGMALGPNAKDGPHTVTVEYDGTNTVLATLEAPHVRQWRLDVAIDQTVKLLNSGDSEVHVYGYQVSTAVRLDDSDEESDDDEDYELAGHDDSEDEDFDEDEVDLSRMNGKLRAKLRSKAIAASPRSDAMDTEGDDEDEDESGEDDEDEDSDSIPELRQLGSDDFIGEAADDEEDEDEEEDVPQVKPGGKRGPQTPQLSKTLKKVKHEVPKSAPTKSSQPLHKPNGGDAKQVPVKGTGKPQEVKVQKDKKLEVKAVEKAEKSVQQDKNGAKSTKLEADKPKGDKSTKDKQGGDKKVENAKGGKKPEAKQAASAEPKSPGGTEEYLTTVVEFLKGQKAPVSLSTLGTAVKKPAGKVKLGPFLKQHPEVFSVEGDKVKLLTK